MSDITREEAFIPPPSPYGSVLIDLLRAELSKARQGPADVDYIRSICLRMGVIPPQFRLDVWAVLLLGELRKEDDDLEVAIDQVELDLPNQNVVEVDVERTRPEVKFFKQSEIRTDLTMILTFYCKEKKIGYKQGMNEVLAPFVALGGRRSTAYRCFEMFLHKFARNNFVDKDFLALQCSFQVFRLMLLYHNPDLCKYLDRYSLSPELYVTPWFLTLFARTVSLEAVSELWDQYLLAEDPLLHYFVALAFLNSKEHLIYSASEATLPETLCKLVFQSQVEVKYLINDGKRLQAETPSSFCGRLYRICNHDMSPRKLEKILLDLGQACCIPVSANEVVQGIKEHFLLYDKDDEDEDGEESDDNEEGDGIKSEDMVLPDRGGRKKPVRGLKFFVLDCRQQEKFDRYHLATSMHLDPKVLEDEMEEKVVFNQLGSMEGKHYCILGSETWKEGRKGAKGGGTKGGSKGGKTGGDTLYKTFVKLFVERSFAHVSFVAGGMSSCERCIHDEALVASPAAANLLKNVMVISKLSSMEGRGQGSNVFTRLFSTGVGKTKESKSRHSDPMSRYGGRKDAVTTDRRAGSFESVAGLGCADNTHGGGVTLRRKGSNTSMYDSRTSSSVRDKSREPFSSSEESSEGEEDAPNIADSRRSTGSWFGSALGSDADGSMDAPARSHSKNFISIFTGLTGDSSGVVKGSSADTYYHSKSTPTSVQTSVSEAVFPESEGGESDGSLGFHSRPNSRLSGNIRGSTDGTGFTPAASPSSQSSFKNPSGRTSLSVFVNRLFGMGNTALATGQDLTEEPVMVEKEDATGWQRSSQAPYPIIDIDRWMSGGPTGREFRVRRMLKSGILQDCVVCLSQGRLLEGIEIAEKPGFVYKIEERDIGSLIQITRKKSMQNHLKLHFEVEQPATSADAEPAVTMEYVELFSDDSNEIVAALDAMVKEQAKEEDATT